MFALAEVICPNSGRWAWLCRNTPAGRLAPTPRRTDWGRPGRHRYGRAWQLYVLSHTCWWSRGWFPNPTNEDSTPIPYERIVCTVVSSDLAGWARSAGAARYRLRPGTEQTAESTEVTPGQIGVLGPCRRRETLACPRFSRSRLVPEDEPEAVAAWARPKPAPGTGTRAKGRTAHH